MRKHLALILSLILLITLPACKADRIDDVSDTVSSTASNSAISTESDANTYEKGLDVFPFLEIDSKYGPGPFSVNDLIAEFGEPTLVGAYTRDDLSDDVGVHIFFSNISFSLVPENSEMDPISPGYILYGHLPDAVKEYPIEEFDKDIKMKVESTNISGAGMEIARGVFIGATESDLRAAYGTEPFRVDGSDGFDLWYVYSSQTGAELGADDVVGSILYYCDYERNPTVKNACIYWYGKRYLLD